MPQAAILGNGPSGNFTLNRITAILRGSEPRKLEDIFDQMPPDCSWGTFVAAISLLRASGVLRRIQKPSTSRRRFKLVYSLVDPAPPPAVEIDAEEGVIGHA